MSTQEAVKQCPKCEGYGAIEGKVCDCESGRMLARDAKHVAVVYNHETGQKDVFIDNDHAPKTKAQEKKERTDRIRAAAPELLEALQLLLSDPVVGGMSARIRDCAKEERRQNPISIANAALAKATGGVA